MSAECDKCGTDLVFGKAIAWWRPSGALSEQREMFCRPCDLQECLERAQQEKAQLECRLAELHSTAAREALVGDAKREYQNRLERAEQERDEAREQRNEFMLAAAEGQETLRAEVERLRAQATSCPLCSQRALLAGKPEMVVGASDPASAEEPEHD